MPHMGENPAEDTKNWHTNFNITIDHNDTFIYVGVRTLRFG